MGSDHALEACYDFSVVMDLFLVCGFVTSGPLHAFTGSGTAKTLL